MIRVLPAVCGPHSSPLVIARGSTGACRSSSLHAPQLGRRTLRAAVLSRRRQAELARRELAAVDFGTGA